MISAVGIRLRLRLSLLVGTPASDLLRFGSSDAMTEAAAVIRNQSGFIRTSSMNDYEPLEFTGRIAGGLRADIKRRAPLFLSDWTDALLGARQKFWVNSRLRCLAVWQFSHDCSRYYMSPEVCENKPYTFKSDAGLLSVAGSD